MEDIYLTIRDSEGKLRPLAVLWRGGAEQKYSQPEIDKYMKKATKEGSTLVKVILTEV